MKVLHTADWHLGQRLVGRERREEHERFLRWLIDCIERHQVDLLIVAGDIFDSGHPPQTAMQLYYDFLKDLSSLGHCTALFVAGNHDSPSHLTAPKQLLKRFQVHVVGSPSDDPSGDLLLMEDGKGISSLCVAAIPYLRERDVRTSIVGEGIVHREQRYRQGIVSHYQKLRALAQPYVDRRIPIMATGHLTLQGSLRAGHDEELNIMGQVLSLEEQDLPEDFAYIALGHLHAAHDVGGNNTMRYAGSPIPINFNESDHEKEVTLLTFKNGHLEGRELLPVPVSRRLYRYGGTLDGLDRWLQQAVVSKEELTPWLEVHLNEEAGDRDLTERVLFRVQDSPFEVLKVLTTYEAAESEAWQEGKVNLVDYHPVQVFEAKCQMSGVAPSDQEELMLTFCELLRLYEERQIEGEKL